MYFVYQTKLYSRLKIKRFSTLHKELCIIEEELKTKPLSGRPLYSTFLREKRIGGKRVFYLVYKEFKLILLIAISDKKQQQRTIDYVKEQLEEYRELAKRINEGAQRDRPSHLQDSS